LLYKVLRLTKKGFFLSIVSDSQLNILKNKKSIFFKISKMTLPLAMQKEIFLFLSLYYSEGENVYNLLLKYQQFAEKKIKKVNKFILLSLRKGLGLVDIIKDSDIFEQEVSSFLSVFSLSFSNKDAFVKIVFFLNQKIKNRKEFLKKLTYPAILLFSCIAMLFFVSEQVIPNFMFFFDDSGSEIPIFLKLMTREYLWRILSFSGVIILFIIFIIKMMPVKIKTKISFFNFMYKTKFQLIFWQICLIAIDTGSSLEDLINEYLKKEKNTLISFYLSTILSRLSRGQPFDKAIDIPLIDKKQKVITTLATDNKRKQHLYLRFLEEAEQNNILFQSQVANMVSVFSLFFIALIIFLLGYVMITPLRQISEII
jgi:type II secretory pathway component PulF